MEKSFKGSLAFLSNFYPCQIEYEGITYPTVEHAYQASKTTNENIRIIFAGNESPIFAKKAGKQVVLREGWDDLKLSIMETLLRIKFSNPRLKQYLLNTGEEPIIERNWWGDRFWGVYLGKGENNLGKLLMKIRKEINDAR